MRVAMTVEGGTAIVLAYVLVSMGVIIAFLLAAFVIGWFIGRLRQRRRPPVDEVARKADEI
jgi:biotin transporter BioY